jgi:plasmid replication initiation protein
MGRFRHADDWHLDRVVLAIRSAAQSRGEPGVADALAAAIAKQEGRERALAQKPEQEETEAARWQEEETVISGLRVELRALRDTDPGMSLLNAVEYVTADPAHRIALYRRCAEDRSVNGMGQDAPRLLEIASSVAKDLVLLERRAKAEGFRV